MLYKVLLAPLLILCGAAAFGFYVYPAKPTLVWALLGLLWACYRLRLRALALFGEPETLPLPDRRAGENPWNRA